MSNTIEIYRKLKHSLYYNEEFVDGVYDIQKHCFFKCDDCRNNDCDTFEELADDLDLIVMEELLKLLLGENHTREEEQELLKTEIWKRAYSSSLRRLENDKSFKIQILMFLLISHEYDE